MLHGFFGFWAGARRRTILQPRYSQGLASGFMGGVNKPVGRVKPEPVPQLSRECPNTGATRGAGLTG